MSEAGNKISKMKTAAALALVLAAGVAAADVYYLGPRYGGILPYFLEGHMAGSMMSETEANRNSIAAALAVYFGDYDGKYPKTLEELCGGRNYMNCPLPGEHVFVHAGGDKFQRAHWRRDNNKVKIFSSRAEADDSGGWGYVADPVSPEWGTVFVNCTHQHYKKGVAWNMAFEPATQPQRTQPEADDGQNSPGKTQ